MKLIYKNKYGACYDVANAPNPECKFQIIVEGVGIFMSRSDLNDLLKVVKNSHNPCYCESCKGRKCNKIWCTNILLDVCLKVNEPILSEMEDLILGTLFMLEMNDILE